MNSLPKFLNPKPSPIKNTVGSAHNISDSTVTDGCTRANPHPSQTLGFEESAIIIIISQQITLPDTVQEACSDAQLTTWPIHPQTSNSKNGWLGDGGREPWPLALGYLTAAAGQDGITLNTPRNILSVVCCLLLPKPVY